MQQPSNLNETGLKRLARFLGVRPRLVWFFKWQKRVTRLESWCDTDHAGCIRFRKSVSGCGFDAGWQALIAVSSSKAECYGFVSVTSKMLRLQIVLLDWRRKFKVDVWRDVTAGSAIGSQRGLGRVKHSDTVFLWVQAVVIEGKISLGKKPTKEMLVDFLTKHVDAATMLKCVTGLRLKFQSGECKLLNLMEARCRIRREHD